MGTEARAIPQESKGEEETGLYTTNIILLFFSEGNYKELDVLVDQLEMLKKTFT